VRAVVYARAGDVDAIELRDVPDPVPGSNDVLVDVAYAGINRADLLERAGRYGPPEPATGPAIPGLEYSGTVAAAGAQVRGLAPGDRVFGIVSGGAHAERLVTHADTAMRVPGELDLAAAAAIPEAFMTAWDALFTRGGFSLGQTVLIHAVGSGVGLAALALAKVAGGKTVGTSRTLAKLERASDHGLGAGVLLDDDWPARVHEISGGRGADVVLDFVGIPTFDRNVASLAVGGRIVQIGTLGGVKGQIALGPMMAKRATLISTMLRARPLHEKIALAKAFSAHIVPLFATGALRPIIDRIFPLDEIREAHTYVEDDRNFGKVLLAIDP
jgi:putative PIG3 family NAD(P)H quinone oxidoreductase